MMLQELINRYKRMRTEGQLAQTIEGKYAFVGMGQHSLTNLYPVIDYLRVPLKYICVTSEKKAELIQAKYPGVKATTSLSEILEDKEVMGVFVAAAPSAHFSIASKVLRAGKALFVEKPVCSNSEELEQLIGMAGDTTTSVGLQLRYAPATRILAHKLKKDTPKNYHLSYRTGAYPEGDALLDLFIHPIDLLNALFGKADILSSKKVDDSTYVLMLQHDGVCGTLELSTGCSWSDAELALEVVSKNGLYRLKQMEELTFEKSPSMIFGVPVEKVLPGKRSVEILYGRNNMIPVPANNQLVSLGFYDEIRSFVQKVEGKPADIATDLPSLRETYRLLDALHLL